MPTAQASVTKFSGGVAAGAVPNNVTGATAQNIAGPVRVSLGAAAAASSTFYINAHSADGSTQTVNKSPAVARNVTIVASGATTANVVISGLDTNGYPISETLALNGTTSVVGRKSYSKILTVALPTVAATTVDVGTGVVFGLPLQATEATVFLALVDGAADSSLGTFANGGTTAGTDYYGTWSPATAPNGTHVFAMYYIPTSLVNYGVNN
jgi:hypothetical protein